MPTVHLYKTFQGPVKNALTSMSFSLEEKCCHFLVSGGSYICSCQVAKAEYVSSQSFEPTRR